MSGEQRYAKFHVLVHASNRAPVFGKAVVVIAQTRAEAVSRAIDLGWSGDRRHARVTFDRIEDIDPRECTHGTTTRLLPGSEDRCDGCGRVLDCCGNCCHCDTYQPRRAE